jgi:competence protein ComEA
METSAMDRLRWLLTLMVLGASGLALLLWWRAAPASDATALLPAPAPLSTVLANEPRTSMRPELGVDVIGAIQRPDLYYLPEGARVADAIKAAGGFAPDADREAVNLAARLRDEQQVRVPRVGDSQVVARDVEPTGDARIGGQLDLNLADAAALEALPGVGPTIASRIIDYRKAHGPFRSVDQLDEISGIGAETLAELRNLVTVVP